VADFSPLPPPFSHLAAAADPVTAQVKLPAEAATTTVTLPAAPSRLPTVAEMGHTYGAMYRLALLGAGLFLGAALVLVLELVGARATATRAGPGEALLEQAATALSAGRREQALALLLRHQLSDPDRTVEIFIRTLRKDLQKELPAGAPGSRSP
jgi:hypothetical protein